MTGSETTWGAFWSNNPSCTSAYVAGVPYFASAVPMTEAGPFESCQAVEEGVQRGYATDEGVEQGEGKGGGEGEGGGYGRYRVVHTRPPRYEGLEGLRVFRGLLRTSVAMQVPEPSTQNQRTCSCVLRVAWRLCRHAGT